MANPYIWADLARATNDPTTIDQAIATATAAHNDDPDAHLGTDQSLQSHRASEIIDHLAESVVNDKLNHYARSYVAIVGSGVDGDYDTIEAAIAYAISVDGGTIFLTPGEYYLSTTVDIPLSINIVGADRESVIVHGHKTSGLYLRPVPDTVNNQSEQIYQNITFVNDGGGVIYSDDTDFVSSNTIFLQNCNLTGGGTYLQTITIGTKLDGCNVELGGAGALLVELDVRIYKSVFTRLGSNNTIVIRDTNTDNGEVSNVRVYDTSIFANGANAATLFPSDTLEELWIINCFIVDWKPTTLTVLPTFFFNSNVQLYSSSYFETPSGIGGGMWVGNRITNGATPNVKISGDSGTFVGNFWVGQPVVAGTGNFIEANSYENMFTTLSGAATACALDINQVAQLTPNSTRTLTTAVPLAGKRRSFIVLTSGTTTYTLTFGTGFKTTGTLATGATSARRFVIEFISDGTYLIETSRTTAIA